MKGIVSTTDLDPKSAVEKARASEGIVGKDLVREVTCKSIYEWTGSEAKIIEDYKEGDALKVVVFDFGVKMNILRILKGMGCKVIVVPASTSAYTILGLGPDGVLLSNGPGYPWAIPYAVKEVKGLLDKVPLFGICLGQQVLGLALGGRTYKLKFGHHGANQPIKELDTGKVFIASENHGFAVEIESIKGI
jgi:carbamoyl-phosphate synthase small subunit